MEAQSLSTCNQCGKKFQRKAHLLRHQQQHSEIRPYSCKFCSKTFKRSDVLRDHFSRCEQRGNASIPQSLERGRKRHACDECSRLKVKCDNNVPCRKCVEFGRKCVKTRPAGASSPEATPSSHPSTPDASSDRNSIGFLLNCPGDDDGFLQEFPKSATLSPRQKEPEGLSNIMSMERRFEPQGELSGPASVYYGQMVHENNLDVLLSNLEFQTFEQQTQNWQMPGENMIPWSGSDSTFLNRGVLEQRAHDIREKLKYTAATQNPPHPPSTEVLEALHLITADTIAAYIKLYFRHWHKHGPMVHEATFNPCTAALPLVLSLMSLGGMYSNDAEDVTRLKSLLDTIEAYVYSIPGLNDEYELPDRIFMRQGEQASTEWQQYQLEELQGAYLMIVLQYWTGNPTARTRVRQQRFTRYVSLFHHHEMESVQHSPNFEIRDQASFREWIRKESYIRMATLSVMLDHAFGIFNNVPPRFQWSELDLPFPGDDKFFSLPNFDAMVQHHAYPKPRMKIKDSFLLLFSPSVAGNENPETLRNGNMTALDMQMLIHFLYTSVWAATFANPLVSLPSTNLDELIAPFKSAMHNWRTIWDEIKATTAESEWNKLGFQRTAESYFDAVQAVIDLFERTQGRFPPFPSDCEKGSHLKRLLSF